MAIKEAIASAVVHLTVQGVKDRIWLLKDETAVAAPVIKAYLEESENNMREVNSEFP